MPMHKFSAVLLVDLGKHSNDYARLLKSQKKYKRSAVIVKQRKEGVEIKVTAKDTVALVASLVNTIKQLRLVESVGKIANSKQEKG